MESESVFKYGLTLTFLFLSQSRAFYNICDDLISMMQIFLLYKLQPFLY